MDPLYRTISRRLVPFLVLLYLIAYLDRVNISFAALTMNRDLNIGASLYGVAAGVFFIGYFFFEVPGNLMLLRVGARRWIMTIMIVWGIVSVVTAFVPGTKSYIALRFLLGAAEAGFFPGVILYLTFWLPPSVRSSVMALFITANPLSGIFGSPISAQILRLDSALGLKGWQWLFIIEGAPAIFVGVLVYFLLPNGPDDARWLTAEQKRKLQRDLSATAPSHSGRRHSLLDAFTAQPRVYAWSLAYFLLMLGSYVLNFWIPTVLTSFGVGLSRLGWLTSLPYCAGIISMVLWSRRSDRRHERRFHLTAAYVAAAGGFVLAAFASNSAIAITAFSCAAAGIISALPVFWSASTLELAGPAVAAHIAVINSIGNLGGFFGPVLMGWLRQHTQSYFGGLASIAICLLCGAFSTAKLCSPSAAVAGAVATATKESAQP
jgi:ACS family tartrate transporter-like MFS transporter